MNTAAAIDTTRMQTAFDLVCPGKEAAELAARGILPAAAAAACSWRDQIAALVTCEELAAAGVTIDDVRAAVEFYTATAATITAVPVGGLAWVTFLQPRDGFLVVADGYRRGPAGP